MNSSDGTYTGSSTIRRNRRSGSPHETATSFNIATSSHSVDSDRAEMERLLRQSLANAREAYVNQLTENAMQGPEYRKVFSNLSAEEGQAAADVMRATFIDAYDTSLVPKSTSEKLVRDGLVEFDIEREKLQRAKKRRGDSASK